MPDVNRVEKRDLRGLTLARLAQHLRSLEIPESRAAFLFSRLYQLGSVDISQLGGLKKEYRQKLAAASYVSALKPAEIERSADGTVKYGFILADGAVIEAVLIPGAGRYTLCLSSQVGCAMACSFCLTGAMGFQRNLMPAEMVNQVVAVMEHMRQSAMSSAPPRKIINNLVFMGMGEPLLNYDNLLTALTILMEERGFEFTERRVTVSTCGIVPKIEALGREARVNLAVSLHAADDTSRTRLMPINRKYPLERLLEACRAYPLGKKKVILFEYILIAGVNDAGADAERLAEILSGIPCRINLMPFNESEDLPYKSASLQRIEAFQAVLRKAGLLALVRNSRGADISAACGQLASRVARG
jgi:23S rRNA (adenine2503-C2)-methyltransferase